MLDIAIVTPRYPPNSSGGGETSAKLLATQLARTDGIGNVTVYSFDGAGIGTNDGVTVARLGTVSSTVTELQNVQTAWKLRKQLQLFDIVHAYNMELHPTVGFVSDRYDIPSVATLNSYHFFPASVTNTTPGSLERLYELIGQPTTGTIMRHYMKRIDAFVALSQSIRDIYTERGFGECHIEQINNMIDPEFRPPADRSTDGYSLLYVGSLTENKGVQYLIRALSSLPEQYHLRIVGTGPRRNLLAEQATSLGVSDRVEFSGYVPYDQIGAVYAEADIFVHPGIWPEPLNRTVLEAMQAGLPVVCTDIGGPPEVIPDRELLCEPGNPSALAASIESAREQSAEIGERNQKHVSRNHDPSVIVPEIVDLYHELSGR